MLLNCALLTVLDDIAISITPPRPEVLARYGLMFGLAHHSAPTSFVGETEAATSAAGLLAEWRRPWTPGTKQQWLHLFGPTESHHHGSSEPSVLGPQLAAFVNPHLVQRVPRGPRVSHVVRPWLFDLLPRARHTTDRNPGMEFTDDLGRAIDELVDNVGCHAVASRASARTVRSAVFLLLARGNSGDVRDRIYIVVLDTGPGILATARPKIDKTPLSFLTNHSSPRSFNAGIRHSVALGDLAFLTSSASLNVGRAELSIASPTGFELPSRQTQPRFIRWECRSAGQ